MKFSINITLFVSLDERWRRSKKPPLSIIIFSKYIANELFPRERSILDSSARSSIKVWVRSSSTDVAQTSQSRRRSLSERCQEAIGDLREIQTLSNISERCVPSVLTLSVLFRKKKSIGSVCCLRKPWRNWRPKRTRITRNRFDRGKSISVNR